MKAVPPHPALKDKPNLVTPVLETVQAKDSVKEAPKAVKMVNGNLVKVKSLPPQRLVTEKTTIAMGKSMMVCREFVKPFAAVELKLAHPVNGVLALHESPQLKFVETT